MMLSVVAGVLILYLLFLVIGWFAYHKFGIGKRIFHDIFQWHVSDESKDTRFDGCSVHCVCKHCGKDIMQDSQGNWF